MIYYTNTKFKSLYNTENLNKKQKICEKVKQNKKNIIRNTTPTPFLLLISPLNLETKLVSSATHTNYMSLSFYIKERLHVSKELNINNFNNYTPHVKANKITLYYRTKNNS